MTLLVAAQSRAALTRFPFNVIHHTKPCTGEVFIYQPATMHETKLLTTLQTIRDKSVNVGDMILATDQRVAKRKEVRNDCSVV